MYDPAVLKTVEDCRTVMARAKERGLDQVYEAVFRRSCEIAGRNMDDPRDPLIRAFHETLTAYEQLLTEKNGRNTSASRTRMKIDNKGVEQSLIDWTRSNSETMGLNLLVERGMPEYTGEYLVARFASRFPKDVVEKAHSRLHQHDITVPEPE